MKPLHGNVAIVTGAGRGIGFAVAERLANDGVTVILLDADAANVEAAAARVRASGGNAEGHAADVSSKQDIDRLFDAIAERHGRIDILVNMAGVWSVMPFEDVTLDEWRRVMSVNLDGTFFCCQAAYRHMKRASYGRIVNIASTAVDEGTSHMAHYTATKGGVIALARVIATEGGVHGITANTVLPGFTISEGTRAMPIFEDLVAATLAAQRIKRSGQPADIAGAIAYLVSPEASFVTGQTVRVNGGLSFG